MPKISENHMTVGELIEVLSLVDQELPVQFDFANFVPWSLHSYRGYYEDVAISYHKDVRVSVAELIGWLRELTTVEGYKGGVYRVTDETPVWVALRDEVTRTGVVDVVEDAHEVVLRTDVVE